MLGSVKDWNVTSAPIVSEHNGYWAADVPEAAVPPEQVHDLRGLPIDANIVKTTKSDNIFTNMESMIYAWRHEDV